LISALLREGSSAIDINHLRPDAVLLSLLRITGRQMEQGEHISDFAEDRLWEHGSSYYYNQKQRALTSSQEQTEGKECRP